MRIVITDDNGNPPTPSKENGLKALAALEKVADMLRADPTAGVYTMYVSNKNVEHVRTC